MFFEAFLSREKSNSNRESTFFFKNNTCNQSREIWVGEADEFALRCVYIYFFFNDLYIYIYIFMHILIHGEVLMLRCNFVLQGKATQLL